MSAELRIRFAGTGGQGIAVAALLLAEAAIRAGRNATHSQSYGPESRGGASRADVIVSDGDIAYPIASALDALVALAPAARARYVADLRPAGLLLVDADALDGADERFDTWCLPIARTARACVGNGPGANLVALGALVRISGAVPFTAVEAAIRARPPGGSLERALIALRAGAELAARPRTAEKEGVAIST
ncbi:MAG TPA: 2-oxoacid:acceptor oxidoreductase family protein [Candidatus Limnocylindria bacterium]